MGQLTSSSEIAFPSIRIPQPDGSVLFRAGKPVVLDPWISVPEAATLLGLSSRTVEYQCSVGMFRTARKPGRPAPNGASPAPKSKPASSPPSSNVELLKFLLYRVLR